MFLDPLREGRIAADVGPTRADEIAAVKVAAAAGEVIPVLAKALRQQRFADLVMDGTLDTFAAGCGSG